MDDDELGIGVRAKRVAVDGGGRSVGSPSGVSDGDLGQERPGGVHRRVGDLLAQTSDLSNLLEVVNLALSVSIDANARRIVATVFLTSEAVAEDLTNGFAVLRYDKSSTSPNIGIRLISEAKPTFSWR